MKKTPVIHPKVVISYEPLSIIRANDRQVAMRQRFSGY